MKTRGKDIQGGKDPEGGNKVGMFDRQKVYVTRAEGTGKILPRGEVRELGRRLVGRARNVDTIQSMRGWYKGLWIREDTWPNLEFKFFTLATV